MYVHANIHLPACAYKMCHTECYMTQCRFFFSLNYPFSAQQQVDFLLLRRQAFMRAALRSKQMKVSADWIAVAGLPAICVVFP